MGSGTIEEHSFIESAYGVDSGFGAYRIRATAKFLFGKDTLTLDASEQLAFQQEAHVRVFPRRGGHKQRNSHEYWPKKHAV